MKEIPTRMELTEYIPIEFIGDAPEAIKNSETEHIQAIYQKLLEQIEEFYGNKWEKEKIPVHIMASRAEFDKVLGHKTPLWHVASSNERGIFILSPAKYDTESNHKYDEREFQEMLGHEIAHQFYKELAGGKIDPRWLNEGLSIVASGQINHRKKPRELSSFLKYQTTGDKSIYKESGFAVRSLIERFDKERVFLLVRSVKDCLNIDQEFDEEKFKQSFLSIFGEELEYETFN